MPSASSAAGSADATQLHPLEQRTDERRLEVGQRHDVVARHDEHVPLEHGRAVEERDDHVVVEHDVGRGLATDDDAQNGQSVASARTSLSRSAMIADA